MKRNIHSPYSLKGLTLIEIMIALVIGSFLMLGAMGLFMSNKRIYNEQDAMGRLQENGRFAIDLLVNDLRMAGYLGCHDIPGSVVNTLGTAGVPPVVTSLFSDINLIEGSETAGGWLPSASTDPESTRGTATAADDSDAITIRYIDPETLAVASLSANMATAAVPIPLTCTTSADCTTDFTVTENIAISDCASADIFSVNAVSATSLTPSFALSKAYSTASQISRYVTNRYFIGAGTNGPSLFRRTFTTIVQDQELIEGVENMQILYGVDNTAIPDQVADSYQTATNVAANGGWVNVVSVKIAMLIRTIVCDANNEIDLNTYNLLGTVIGPTNDQCRRRVFSTTVQIRNRT